MEIRVYYEDTDCGNVVYYANYLKYMERSRTEYLRDRGIDLAEYQRNGITFVVVEAHVKYRSPEQYNDLLTVESSVVEMTSATVMFTTNITRRGQLLVKGDVKLACLTSSGKAGKIPQEIRDALVS